MKNSLLRYSLFLFFIFPTLLLGTEFVVLITSYNNEQYVIKNLDSLKNQSYKHWKAIYIDDASSDKTFALVTQYVSDFALRGKIKVVQNKKNIGGMANYFKWINRQDPRKVIVLLDGDDRLSHSGVLQRLANAYADENVWMTYGNFVAEPDTFLYTCEKLPPEVIEKNAFRSYHWVTSHLKTFYAKLFHLIDVEYLLYQGQYVPMASDQAMMLCMLEMASKGHILFIDEVLYIYNYQNPLNDEKKDQQLGLDVVKEIRAKPGLKPLDALF